MDSDIQSFLEKHVRPYDPDSDDYERPPFAADIKEGKNDPIYNAHSYHTKVPPRSIIPYILHYTKPGDVVLDPFCGSGMTGVAAQMCADPPKDILQQFPELADRVGPRACILNDLSPAACHIAYNYNAPVNVPSLNLAIEKTKAVVRDEFVWLYGTEHYEPAVGFYAPTQPEIAVNLKNPPSSVLTNLRLDTVEPTWELIPKEEVERRLGYPVTDLPRDKKWGELELAQVDNWICIPAIIQYTIWSDVYNCQGFVTIEEATGKISVRGKNVGKPITSKRRVERGCGLPLVLWSVARNNSTGEVYESFNCPSCSQNWKKSQLKWISSTPVAVNLSFETLQSRSQRSHGQRKRIQRDITRNERIRLEEISQMENPHWIPKVEMDPNGPRYRRSALQVRGIRQVTDFWTPRNRWAFSAIWAATNEIAEPRLQSATRFLLTSFVTRVSRKSEYRVNGGAGNSHNLVIPSITREDNILKSMAAKETDIINYYNTSRLSDSVSVNVGSATSLISIESDSIDYIFTDPPFGSNIYYSEPNLLWESWLGELTNEEFEAVVHRVNDGGYKRLDDYERLMSLALAEMFRVLKPGRFTTMEFNNSDGAVFEAVKRAVRNAGFEITNMLLLDKDQKSFFQIKGASGEVDTVDKDVLFNLLKPASGIFESRTEEDDLELEISAAVREHLKTLPVRIAAEPIKYSDDHRTTATINSMLMNALIPRGVSVERLNLPFIERVCSRYFRKIGQRWFLRGETIGGRSGALLAEEVGVSDELSAVAWLRQNIQTGPKLTGELKPLWMRATGLLPTAVSRPLDLERLLRENFWRDADSNRWREPTDEERERMTDDRSLRVLHDADRLANGTFGRIPSATEMCDWITVLFETCKELEEDPGAHSAHLGFDKMEAYRLIVKISHHLTEEGADPAVLTAAKKQAAVAGRRLAEFAEASEAKVSTRRVKDDNQGVLDLGL